MSEVTVVSATQYAQLTAPDDPSEVPDALVALVRQQREAP